MKRSLLIFTVLFSFYLNKAQVGFCKPGSEWRYVFSAMGSQDVGTIAYTHDSLLGAQPVKVLRCESFYKNHAGGQPPVVLIKESADTVFLRNRNTKDTWQILYNFSATPGQSWTTTVVDSSYFGSHIAVTHTVNVNAVTTVTINNMPLKKLSVTYNYKDYQNTPHSENAEIIERIGCTTYLFNYFNRPAVSDYAGLSEFLCYKDNAFGGYNNSPGACDRAVSVPENISQSGDLQAYPVPVNDVLTIDFTGNTLFKNYDIRLLNAMGQQVLKSEIQSGDPKPGLDLRQLSSGIYFLQIFDNGRLMAGKKIVKE